MSVLKNKRTKSLVESSQLKPAPKKRRVSKTKLSEKNALFISDENGFYSVSPEFLRSLSYEQALALGRSTLTEIRVMMVDDVISNTESSIENIKVTTGLNNTLDHLELIYPNILQRIRSIEQENGSTKVFLC
jgi:hypothetical protein